MIKKFIASAIMFSTLAAAGPASATVYELYFLENQGTLTIDTEKAIGSWVNANLNATFSGAGLANFSANASPNGGNFPLAPFSSDIVISADSTYTAGGIVYRPNQVHQQKLLVEGDKGFNLWSWWGTPDCPNCQYIGDQKGVAYGIHASPSSSSSGGTDVPEPGVMGLMGLGVLGMAFGRRRRTKVNLNMAPALA